MLNSYYIISEFNSKIQINLKKNSNINVIFRPKVNDYNNQILKLIIKTNIYNKIYLANKSNICPIKGLAGIYISAFNKKTISSGYFKGKSVIGSAHSIREICEKIRSKCRVIFLSPILKDKTNKKTIGMIKFLLIRKHFKNITLYPLGGVYSPRKLMNYGVSGFAGIEYFNKT